MERVDFRRLLQFTERLEASQLETVFLELLAELKEYLELPVVNSSISIKITDTNPTPKVNSNNIGSCWVTREYEKNHLTLTFYFSKDLIIPITKRKSVTFPEFFPFIILREIFICFLPHQVKKNPSVLVVLFEIIIQEARANKFNILHKWEQFYLAFQPVLFTDLDISKLEKKELRGYFDIDKFKASTTEFIDYVQEYHSIITDNFNFNAILIKSSEKKSINIFLQNESMQETFRCLTLIIQKKRIIRTFTEYRTAFAELKNTFLNTTQSENVFRSNLKILRESQINPSYFLYWDYLGMSVMICRMILHPLIDIYDIYPLFQENLTLYIRKNYNSFGSDVYVGFFLPRIYEKDLVSTIKLLKTKGIITSYFLFKTTHAIESFNLNAMRSTYNMNNLLNPKSKKYMKKFNYAYSRPISLGSEQKPYDFDDFVIFDKEFGGLNMNSLGFDTKDELIESFKSGFNSRLADRLNIFRKAENSYGVISQKSFKQSFKDFIKQYGQGGFFHLKHLLEQVVKSITHIENSRSPNLTHLIKKTKKFQLASNIEENIYLTNKGINDYICSDLIPLYFRSKPQFDLKKQHYMRFLEFLRTCEKLHLYSLNEIIGYLDDNDEFRSIYKEEQDHIMSFNSSMIKANYINTKLANYLEGQPPLMQPWISGIPIPWVSTHMLLLTFSEANWNKCKLLSDYFLGAPFIRGVNLDDDKEYIWVELRTPHLTAREQLKIASIMYNTFESSLQLMKIFHGLHYMSHYMYLEFYSFKEKTFIYSPDRYKALKRHLELTFGRGYRPTTQKLSHKVHKMFLTEDSDLLLLREEIEKRLIKDENLFRKDDLNDLKSLYNSIKDKLSRFEIFKTLRFEQFFLSYIKSIGFIPNYSQFGLGLFYLYIFPNDMDKINYKLLLSNSFQDVWYPPVLENNFPLFIQQVYPFRKRNLAYINRHTVNDKNVREYCTFMVKKIHFNLQFNRNLKGTSKLEWDYPNIAPEFTTYMQKILYNPQSSQPLPPLPSFDLSQIPNNGIYGLGSSEFDTLAHLIQSPPDLASSKFLKQSTIDDILKLLSKGLIYPSIELKNLRLNEQVDIILPNINDQLCSKIMTIFRFFNHCLFHEIEGKMHIHGKNEDVVFTQGLYIKLFLPAPKLPDVGLRGLDDLFRLFYMVFKALDIEHFIIMENLVKASESVIKKMLDATDFDFKQYNPINNLKWSKGDKHWINHKLYNKEMEPQYPVPYYGKNRK